MGCPVLLENNANAAAVAERWYGVGRDIHDFVYIFTGQGFGGGVILGGQPHLGYRGFSGEVCSIPAYHLREGEAHELGDSAAPRHLFARLQGAGLGTSHSELETHYDEGNEIVLNWLEASAWALALVLVTTEYLLDPEAMIFGGLLPAKLTDALIERLSKRFSEFQHVSKAYHPQLLRGATGEHAAALGAATLPIYQALTPETAALGLYARAS